MSEPAKPINVALQGGGAHGAFTWGVLDRLLADPRLKIEGLSGTSAGAMNAACVADGWSSNAAEGARDKLREFWLAVSDLGQLSPIQRSPIDVFMGNWSLDTSPTYVWFDLLSRLASPYQLNPFNMNLLKELLARTVDFERVRHCSDLRLFISATNVESGRVKVFEREELTASMIMASACLPLLFHAVEIDGVPYWDGGYMGNPVLFPFHRRCSSDDVIVVQINPVERPGTPTSARDILNRMNEITFNASLLNEFRAIDFVSRLIKEQRLEGLDYHDMRVHVITADEELRDLGASSKLNAERAFVEHLFEAGYQAAERWLADHFTALGNRGTAELRPIYQGADDVREQTTE
ncbi:MAG: patatin-like phospholipase family protein [Pseudomonadota bacterium]